VFLAPLHEFVSWSRTRVVMRTRLRYSSMKLRMLG